MVHADEVMMYVYRLYTDSSKPQKTLPVRARSRRYSRARHSATPTQSEPSVLLSEKTSEKKLYSFQDCMVRVRCIDDARTKA
jgi:hypothetical protein